jgi:uncharacterized membrane protein
MTQDEINRVEWENPANWSDNIVGVYFSKRDNRVWVPKRRPGVGWTLNLGHRWGAWWLVGLLVIPPVLAGFFSRRTRAVLREASKTPPANPTGADAG